MLENLQLTDTAPVRAVTRHVLVASLAMLVVACGYGTEPLRTTQSTPDATLVRDRIASFQTDTLSYQLRAGANGYEVDIGVNFTNKSPATAYFVNCGGLTTLTLERLEGEKWTTAWSPIIPACLSAPVIVQPFSTFRLVIGVVGGYPGCSCVPTFSATDPSGIYRLVWKEVYSSYNSATLQYSSPLPTEMRNSNAFYLVAQPR